MALAAGAVHATAGAVPDVGLFGTHPVLVHAVHAGARVLQHGTHSYSVRSRAAANMKDCLLRLLMKDMLHELA